MDSVTHEGYKTYSLKPRFLPRLVSEEDAAASVNEFWHDVCYSIVLIITFARST